MEIHDCIIVGGGISGLLLAYMLQCHGTKCKILERDASVDSRKQGFSLTLQEKTKEIFQKYGLLEEINKEGCQTQYKIFYNSDGEIMHHSPVTKYNYPVPRQALRKIFYSKLQPNTVIWNKNISEIDHCNNNIITIVCTDKTLYQTKLLIACDGVNSKIRKKYLPHISLNDLGMMNIYGIIPFDKISENDKEFFKNKTIQILGNKYRLFTKPYDQNGQMWEFTYCVDKFINYTQIEALAEVLDATKIWKLPEISTISKTDPENIIVHPLYDYIPTIADITKLPDNVIFIGDSIHSMAPTIGMGANEAIRDCYEFIELYIKYDKNLSLCVPKYYEEMVQRTSKTVIDSRNHLNFYHSNTATNLAELSKFKKWKM